MCWSRPVRLGWSAVNWRTCGPWWRARSRRLSTPRTEVALRIALFITCLADAMFPEVGQATVRVLERLGHSVDFPAGQTCCGQMHVNTGYQKQALPLVQLFADVFEPYEVVVAPPGSCVGSVRHQHEMLAERFGTPELVTRVRGIAAKTYELSELLVDVLDVTNVGAYFPHRVTYHPTCHSLRMLRVGDKPLRLLRHVDGLELVELPAADQCCGFGGTFAIKNSDTSTAMLADKMRNVLSTGAEICTAGDSSCLMHIGGGLARRRFISPRSSPRPATSRWLWLVAARTRGSIPVRRQCYEPSDARHA